MIDDFGAMLAATVKIFQAEFTLYGVTFSFWQVFLFGIVVAIVFFFIGGAFGGK